MNKRFSLISVVVCIGLLFIQSPPTTSSSLDVDNFTPSDEFNFNLNSSLVGVSEGDSFTYVFEKLNIDRASWPLYRNSTTDTIFEVKENEEFNIKITNATPVKSGDYYTFSHKMAVEFSNSTNILSGTLRMVHTGFMVFTDWNYTYDETRSLLVGLKNTANIDSWNIENGEDEFVWSHNETISSGLNYVEFRFDKITGMLLFEYLNTWVSGNQYTKILKQKDYVHPAGDLDPSITPTKPIDNDISDSVVTDSKGSDFSSTSRIGTIGILDTEETSDVISVPGFLSITTVFILFVTVITGRSINLKIKLI
ncbi:MAG: hypothetical protein HeimC2_15170 [Candidatus Heimdallarchaeota archaeon LC_2]|nr:MAG: hypothetical protein HeimC2_15170 [Candidatus Heimdallarchaeota archaeon LC_2]